MVIVPSSVDTLTAISGVLGVLNGLGDFQPGTQSSDGHADLAGVRRLESGLDFALECGQYVQRDELRMAVDPLVEQASILRQCVGRWQLLRQYWT
jgi:hypothetical protein